MSLPNTPSRRQITRQITRKIPLRGRAHGAGVRSVQHGRMGLTALLVVTGICLCCPHAWCDDLIAPISVTADNSGCFSYSAIFTVDPGPTTLDSVEYQSTNVDFAASQVFGNCAFTIFAGAAFTIVVPGCLIDDTQAGTVTVTLNTCAGPQYVAETTIVPEGGVLDTLLRGDADNSATVVGLLDGLFILNFGFAGGSAPQCLEACDVDGSGQFSALIDGLYVLSFAFAGGTPIPPPFPSCGVDPDSATTLGCDESSCP